MGETNPVQVSGEFCSQQVQLMARRTALLYMAFATQLIEQLGEERGKELIQKSIWEYGELCGRGVREGVEKMGLPLTAENYKKVPDLPAYGWESGAIQTENGESHAIVTYCPLAEVFFSMGQAGLGRLYCFVDQAKQHAYNPAEELVHVHNVLDGDAYCEFARRATGPLGE